LAEQAKRMAEFEKLDANEERLERDWEQNNPAFTYKKSLEAYYAALKSNDWEGVGAARRLTKSRAVELARKKGFTAYFFSTLGCVGDIDYKMAGAVPIEIIVDGQHVPLSAEDYTKDELEIVSRFSKQPPFEKPGKN
jgi:hypothetical protein